MRPLRNLLLIVALFQLALHPTGEATKIGPDLDLDHNLPVSLGHTGGNGGSQ